MEKIIVLNLKMNMDYNDMLKYIEDMKVYKKDFIVCPSNIYIPYFLENGYEVGVQNIFYHDSGSYTGEVSSRQVKSLGVKYTIAGHSERRRCFQETDEQINRKIKCALKNGLEVILCVGEKARGDYKEILKKQILEALDGVSKPIYIAYEPIWAIGSGNTPTKEELLEVINYIKELKPSSKILYGGSVNKENISSVNIKEVSGFLIGNASLSTSHVKQILDVVR